MFEFNQSPIGKKLANEIHPCISRDPLSGYKNSMYSRLHRQSLAFFLARLEKF